MNQPSELTKPKQTSAAQVENMSGSELQDIDNGQGETFQQSVMDEKKRLKYETEKEAELNDAFGYYDRKRQGKLQLTLLDDVVSMLGITLPPTEKRGPLIKLADPQGINYI
jgi:Ca2+-binding EF-hand superfamily protein